MFSHYGQQFTRNAQNGFDCLKLIWSGTFAIFNTKPLWFWSRIGSKVKMSHEIQPSNLSSALLGLSDGSKIKILFSWTFVNYITNSSWEGFWTNFDFRVEKNAKSPFQNTSGIIFLLGVSDRFKIKILFPGRVWIIW